jgi:hypothetical protein
MKSYQNLIKKIQLFNYNIKLIKYHIKDPEPGTFWYSIIDCRSYFLLRVLVYKIGVIFILLLFGIYKFLKKHESLIVFTYIIWFCFSLFYIEFLRI